MGCIYMATNLVNGKSYVGKTAKPIWQRIKAHEGAAAHSKCTSYFHRAIRKYGPECFQWRVVFHDVESDELSLFEMVTIWKMKTKVPYGYNLTDGGDGRSGYKHTAKTKRKISASLSGRERSIETRRKLSGRKVSAETRRKLSTAHLGKKMSVEARRKMSAGLLGRKVSAETRRKISVSLLGKKRSIETRRKISASLLGNKCACKDKTCF